MAMEQDGADLRIGKQQQWGDRGRRDLRSEQYGDSVEFEDRCHPDREQRLKSEERSTSDQYAGGDPEPQSRSARVLLEQQLESISKLTKNRQQGDSLPQVSSRGCWWSTGPHGESVAA
jgi:hypothetical protein